MDKQKNQFVVLFVVVLLGFMYTYIQFLFLPQWGELKNISAELSNRQAYLERLKGDYKILSILKNNVEELSVKQMDLKKRIPTELDKPDIMMVVYAMAHNNRLSPGNLSFEALRQEGQIVSMGMGFTCTGSRDDIHTLVEKFLNDNKYIFVLDSISYSGAGQTLSANMRLTAYALNR